MAKIEELKAVIGKEFLFDVTEKGDGKIIMPYIGLREGRLMASSPSGKYVKINGSWYDVEEINIKEILE
jgi:hypothetical protein